MSYCFNPHCQNPDNPDRTDLCRSCQTALLLGDRFLAIRMIGQGNFGRTFLAIDRHQANSPRCVVKQFFPQNLGNQKAVALFQQEALRLKELGRHERIPEFIEVLEQDGWLYLVQEWIDGESLAQELEQIRSFSEIRIRQLLLNLLPVLQFVHEQQVIHRDIKPENIIRRAGDRQLYLVDFGAAKLATKDLHSASANAAVQPLIHASKIAASKLTTSERTTASYPSNKPSQQYTVSQHSINGLNKSLQISFAVVLLVGAGAALNHTPSAYH